MSKITLGPKKGKLVRNQIRPNQDYLQEWDEYQLKYLNADMAAGKVSDAPILLPIQVGIEDGIMVRDRIKVPQLQTIMGNAGGLESDTKVAAAVDSYIKFFVDQDGSQSATPPTPLDMNIARHTMKLFYLKHDNWKFTDHTQYSVDNVPPGLAKTKMFDVLGTVDNGRGLLVHDHCWTWDDEGKGKSAERKKFTKKYNLHVSVFQRQGEAEYRTDIIIDPWGNQNDDVDPN